MAEFISLMKFVFPWILVINLFAWSQLIILRLSSALFYRVTRWFFLFNVFYIVILVNLQSPLNKWDDAAFLLATFLLSAIPFTITIFVRMLKTKRRQRSPQPLVKQDSFMNGIEIRFWIFVLGLTVGTWSVWQLSDYLWQTAIPHHKVLIFYINVFMLISFTLYKLRFNGHSFLTNRIFPLLYGLIFSIPLIVMVLNLSSQSVIRQTHKIAGSKPYCLLSDKARIFSSELDLLFAGRLYLRIDKQLYHWACKQSTFVNSDHVFTRYKKAGLREKPCRQRTDFLNTISSS